MLLIVLLCVCSASASLNATEGTDNSCFGLLDVKDVSTVHLHGGVLHKVLNSASYVAESPSKRYYTLVTKSHLLVYYSGREAFVASLQSMRGTRGWDSRVKYLVYTSIKEDVGVIFREAWDRYVLNLNVVLLDRGSVYRHHPYSELGNCGKDVVPVVVGSCANGDHLTFPDNVPTDLKGCPVRLMPYAIQPYVLDLRAPREEPAKAGLEVTILHVLSRRMNFTQVYQKNPHVHWGYRMPDGTYTLMYKSLYDGETDAIFGFTYGNISYTEDFDPSYCHLQESSVWYVPRAGRIPQWQNLTTIFQGRLWACIFGGVLLQGVACRLLGARDLTLALMSSLYVLLQGSVASPHRWRLRLVFGPWLFACLLIFTAHQSQLVSILTTPLYEAQISTLDDLLRSGTTFGFYPTIEDAYSDRLTTTDVEILGRYRACPLTTECLNRTAFRRDFAVVKNRRQVLYLMPRYYTAPDGRTMLHELREIAFSSRPRYNLRKGFPLLQRWDSLLMRMCEVGLIDWWDRDVRGRGEWVVGQELEALTLGHLQGAFYVLAFGVTLATVALLAEMLKATKRR